MRRASGNGQARAAAALGAAAVDATVRPEAAAGPLNGQARGPRAFFVAGAGPARLLTDRLPAAPRGLLRLARRRARSMAGVVSRRWHRSRRLRVIGATVVVSMGVDTARVVPITRSCSDRCQRRVTSPVM